MDGLDAAHSSEALATARLFVRNADPRALGMAIDHLRHAQELAERARKRFLAETDAIREWTRTPRSARERQHSQLGLEILGRKDKQTDVHLRSWRALFCEAVSAFSSDLESSAEAVDTSLGRFPSFCHAIAAGCRAGQLSPAEFLDRARQEQQVVARRDSAAVEPAPEHDPLERHQSLQIRLLQLLADKGPMNMTKARRLLGCSQPALFAEKDVLLKVGAIQDASSSLGRGVVAITDKGRGQLDEERANLIRLLGGSPPPRPAIPISPKGPRP